MDQNEGNLHLVQNAFQMVQKNTHRDLISTIFQMDERMDCLQQAGDDKISFYTNLRPRIFIFDPSKLQIVKVIELLERLIPYLDSYFFTQNLETLVINSYYEGTFIMQKNDKLLKEFGKFTTFGITNKSLFTRSQSPIINEDTKKKFTIKEFQFDGTQVRNTFFYTLPQSLIRIFKNSILVISYNTRKGFIILPSNRTIHVNIKIKFEAKFVFTLGSSNGFIFGETFQKARHLFRLESKFKLVRKVQQSIFVYGYVTSQNQNIWNYPKELQQKQLNNIEYVKRLNIQKDSRQKDIVATRNQRYICQAVEKQLLVIELPTQ